jgi:hypothetical protein
MVLGLSGCSKKDTADIDGTSASNGAQPTGTDAAEGAAQAPETADAAKTADTAETTGTGEAAGTAGESREAEPIKKSSATLTVSRESGVYDGEFDLEIACDAEAEIYYTTDGSNPVTSSTRILYSGPVRVTDRSGTQNYMAAVDPFLYDAANVRVNGSRDGFVSSLDSTPANDAVDKCSVIRAVAVDGQGAYTDVASNTYFIGSMADHIRGIEESCKAAGTSLAVISLSMNYEDLFDPKTGIYVKGDIFDEALKDYLALGKMLSPDTSRQLAANYNQKGREWERNVHMDFFESDGTATTLGLQQDCGIRIQGNYSRSDLQKGFRLYARKEYGKNNFEYAIFGEGLKNDAGETLKNFKTLTLRNGGNCAFTTKFSDTYWQSLVTELDCETQSSRPCVVYLNGEYWGLYVLQEDYSQEYFEYAHGVDDKEVVLYKGDAEALELGYKLDLGDLPAGVQDESYYFRDLLDFFNTHEDLSEAADYEAFGKLVDIESVRDYFAMEIWINNKWDWPGKNWSLWRTANVDADNPYADGRWRFCIYDVEFGGVSGAGDAFTNTIKEDNYKPAGLLDRDTTNPAVLTFVYLMSNEDFRSQFAASLQKLSRENFNYTAASAALDVFKDTYNPLYDQFFERYPGSGSARNSIDGGYASYKCIMDFLRLRADHIQPMLDYVDSFYNNK